MTCLMFWDVTFLALTCIAAGMQPIFLRSLPNITVPVGREAIFTCTIAHLGGHKVAWIKLDSHAILAVDEIVLVHPSRLSVVRNDYNTWTLTLREVRLTDSGSYMCQVNTDPVRHQVGTLEVVLPPDIVTSETSNDVVVSEGGSAEIQCRAKGHPPPTITWRREDGRDIVLRRSRKVKVQHYTGETLHLSRVTRADMGVYLCIASNGVPPPVSKRTMVSVHFPPTVKTATGLIAAPVGSNVSMLCRVEASPSPIQYWATEAGEVILSGPRRNVSSRETSPYSTEMRLSITAVTPADFRTYFCVAKNAVSEAQDALDLHEIEVAARPRPDAAQRPADHRAAPAGRRRGQDLLGRRQDAPSGGRRGQRQPPARPQLGSGAAPAAGAGAAPLLLTAARLLLR